MTDARFLLLAALPIGLALACTGDRGPPSRDRPGDASSNPPPAATRRPSNSAGETEASAPKPEPKLTALGGPRFVDLDVPGHEAAVVALPVGAREPRPWVIATHGNYDRPEWQCEVWSEIVDGQAFVLCPRGRARADSPGPDDVRFTYGNNRALEEEIDAATAALRATHFASYLSEAPPLYAGFSLGAIMGVAIASRRPADFPRLVLIEGGVAKLNAAAIKKLADGGTKAVLLACAQAGCDKAAQAVADRFAASSVRSRVVYAGAIGHSYSGPVADAVAVALPEWLSAEPEWKPWLREMRGEQKER